MPSCGEAADDKCGTVATGRGTGDVGVAPVVGEVAGEVASCVIDDEEGIAAAIVAVIVAIMSCCIFNIRSMRSLRSRVVGSGDGDEARLD